MASLQCDLDYDLASISNFPKSHSTRGLLSALNGFFGDTDKMLTYTHTTIRSSYTHFHTVTGNDRFLANHSPNVTFPLCSVAMAAINCSKVFMCRSSAKGLIVLTRSTQRYQLCTLTPLRASVAHCYLRAELRLCGILAKTTASQKHNSELQGDPY